MRYKDYLGKTSFSSEELTALSWGAYLDDPPSEGFSVLPSPPMMMLDRIVELRRTDDGAVVVAEHDVMLDHWFFQSHFRPDPIMPGCLGLAAVWQVLSFYASLEGGVGLARGLGAGKIEFFGQIRPFNNVVRYEVKIGRCEKTPDGSATIAHGSADIYIDDQLIYTMHDLSAGMFREDPKIFFPSKDVSGREFRAKDEGVIPINFETYIGKTSFTKKEIMANSMSLIVNDEPELTVAPTPPLQVLDRITEITHNGVKGRMVGERDVTLSNCFFHENFRSHPVMPDCLMVEGLWQVIGWYASVRGGLGVGRALGCEDLKITGQVRPEHNLIKYEINVKRYAELKQSGASVCVGDGNVYVDGELMCTAKNVKLGIFKGLKYPDFPYRSKNSLGGSLQD